MWVPVWQGRHQAWYYPQVPTAPPPSPEGSGPCQLPPSGKDSTRLGPLPPPSPAHGHAQSPVHGAPWLSPQRLGALGPLRSRGNQGQVLTSSKLKGLPAAEWAPCVSRLFLRIITMAGPQERGSAPGRAPAILRRASSGRGLLGTSQGAGSAAAPHRPLPSLGRQEAGRGIRAGKTWARESCPLPPRRTCLPAEGHTCKGGPGRPEFPPQSPPDRPTLRVPYAIAPKVQP